MNSGTVLKEAYFRALNECQSRNRGLDVHFNPGGITFRLHDHAGSDQIDTCTWQQLEELGRSEQIVEGFAQMIAQLDDKLRFHGK